MKRILSLFLPVFFFLSAQGQTQRVINMPGFQQLGTPSTQTRINGILYPQVGYAPAMYTDTATANANSYLKNIPFAQISTSSDGKNWYRSLDATKWNEFGGSSTNSNIGSGYRLAVPGTNNVKTLYAVNGLTLDSTSNANALTWKFGGTLTDDTTLVNQDSKRLRFYGNETMFDSLRLTAAGESDYLITHRKINFASGPVVNFTPKDNNKVIAFDIMPRGAPSEVSGQGYAWLDVCDRDVSSTLGSGVVAARVGITSTAAQFGSKNFDGASAKDVEIVVDTDKRITLSTNNTATFNIGKITQSQSLSGDFVGYYLLNTNNTVAESNPIFFIGQDIASNRFGYLRWNNNASAVSVRAANSIELVGGGGATGGVAIRADAFGAPIRFTNNTGSLGEVMRIQDGNVGIGTTTTSAKLHTVGTVRHASLGTASTDTTTYKPLGIDTNGDLIPMTIWPGGGGGGGSQDLDNVLTVGNTSTIGAQFGDSVKIQGGTDPFLSFKQATSNQAYRFRVGVGTGLGSQSFSLYDETAAKTRMVMTATGNMLIGGTSAPSAHSRLLVYGGTSGANIDALPDSADNDESNIEVMGADYYGSSFPGYGVAMQFNGNANSGSILGYSKKNFGQLRFTGETNFIRVISNRSLRFATNNTEVGVWDSLGRLGVNIAAPEVNLHVVGATGNNTAAIIDCHEDLTGEILNVKQSGSKKFSFHSNGSLEMAETTDPTAAASGYNRLYAQSGKLYTHNDDGRVAQVVQTLQLTFGAGSGADSDTTAFTTSAIYGSFYNDADTIVVTSMRSVLQGTSPDVTYKVWYNDSLNVEAGATALVTAGSQVTNTTTGTNVTSFDVTKIPPGVWVWVKTSTVATKPKYFSLTVNGYRK